MRGAIAGLAAGLALAGCAALSADRRAVVDAKGYADAVESVSGSGTVRSETGCRLALSVFDPSRRRTDVLVVLAPGFLRERIHLAGLARALAARGIPAVTFTPCNTRPWDGGHFRTGLDMGRIARALGAERALYLGFSAGALSALAAARTDRTAVGAVALDLVDSQGLGRLLAPGLDRPLAGLVGEPGRCNRGGNGLAVLRAAPGAQIAVVPGARHCDFESPTDRICEVLCGGADAGAEPRRRAIVAGAAAAVESMLAQTDSAHTNEPSVPSRAAHPSAGAPAPDWMDPDLDAPGLRSNRHEVSLP